MNERCREFDEMLSPWRDGELGPERAREVAEHVADCESCQAKVSSWHESEKALAGMTPTRSDVEWERLAQRVDEAIDADELERIAETLPAAASVSRTGPGPAIPDRAVPDEAKLGGTATDRSAERPAPHLSVRWWAVGSGVAAAALVILFWPWFQQSDPRVPAGPGALRERVGAAGRIEVEQPASVAMDEDAAPERGSLLEADAKRTRNAPVGGDVAKAGPAGAPPADTEASAPPPDAPAADALAKAPPSDADVLAEEIHQERFSRELVIVPTLPDGAESLGEIAGWAGTPDPEETRADSRPNALKSRAVLKADEPVSEAPAPGEATASTAQDALLLAHEARGEGLRERARDGYRLLAGEFEGNDVREDAWYALTELQTEDVRAGSGLDSAVEAAGSLEAFLLEYPGSPYERGVLAARVFVWARLVELDPAYCEGAHERVRDWQTGVEMAPIDVMRAVSTIAESCAR